jgi:hypothetical protein
MAGTLDKDVIVLHDVGFDPDVNGNLTSGLASIIPDIAFLNKMMSCATTAEAIACNPPPATYMESSNVPDSSAVMEGTFAGDQGLLQETETIKYTRTKAQREEYLGQIREFQRMYGKKAAAEYWGIHDDALVEHDIEVPAGQAIDPNGDTMPWARMLNLPPGMRLANLQMPRARGDLVALIKTTRERVCNVVGVSSSTAGQSTRTRVGSLHQIQATSETTRYWAKTLGKILTDCYLHMICAEHLRHKARTLFQQRRREFPDLPASAIFTRNDVKKVLETARVSFIFDITPRTNAEDARLLWETGCITWEKYQHLLMRMNHLEQTEPVDATEPISAEERRAMVITHRPKKRKQKEIE